MLKSELSPVQAAELARCFAAHDLAAEGSGPLLRQDLADCLDFTLWIGRCQVASGEQCVVYLSEGEKCCAVQRFERPYREGAAHRLSERTSAAPDWVYEPITLGNLLATPAACEALGRRLAEDCIAPYAAEDLAGLDLSLAQQVWTWDNGERFPTALLCVPQPGEPLGPDGEFPLLIPAAWGGLRGRWHGGLQLQAEGGLIVCNAQGRYGLVVLRQGNAQRVIGHWQSSCTWPYLAGARHGGAWLLEAASSTAPDARGELVCDLWPIQALGQPGAVPVNPLGVKGLLGSVESDGALVVNAAGVGAYSRVLGRIDRRGVLFKGQPVVDGDLAVVPWGLADLQWSEIGREFCGLTAARAAQNQLWGYVDRSGGPAIPAQYADVWGFQAGLAPVLQPDSVCWGLIDPAGQWVLAPRWRYLEVLDKDLIAVADLGDCWGAVNRQGETVVAFKPFSEWLAIPEVAAELLEYTTIESAWPKDVPRRQRQCVVEQIQRVAKTKFREQLRTAFATCSGSLAAMEGICGARTSERDLREAGIWGQEVRLLHAKTDGVLRPGQGEVGRIACYYPVTLSLFDLSVEAPVEGLATQPEAAIGIRWCDLERVASVPPGPEPEPASAPPQAPPVSPVEARWQMLKVRGATLATVSAYLLAAFFVFIRIGVVGVALSIVLEGLHHWPLLGAVPRWLCVAFLLLLVVQLGRALWGGQLEAARTVFLQAAAASGKLFWWNFGGFVVWAVFLLAFKEAVAPWFAAVWAAGAVLELLKMSKRVWDAPVKAVAPAWPVALIEAMQADFQRQIDADGEDGPCEITCTRSRFSMFMLAFIEDYLERYPELAPHEEQIYKLFNETYGA